MRCQLVGHFISVFTVYQVPVCGLPFYKRLILHCSLINTDIREWLLSAIKKGLENDKKSGKSNFENHIELQPYQSDQDPQCLV